MVVASDSQDGEKGLLKLQKQQAAILKVIEDKKFKPMEIPTVKKHYQTNLQIRLFGIV
ncbi:MAG: hypothetical protein ACXWT1_01305 [Methylobacter sp.]